jgi:hypothetical protein
MATPSPGAAEAARSAGRGSSRSPSTRAADRDGQRRRVHRLGGLVRVVAVQPIQGELNAVEIAAQSDLVRVLTHEIMNSMTPVTSLAHSAADLMAEVDKGDDPDRRRRRAGGRDAVAPRRRSDAFRRELPPDQPHARGPAAGLIEVCPGARARIPVPRQRRAEGVGFTLDVARDG